MASENIKRKIKEILSFNVEEDYYKEENKDKVIELLRDVFFDDDVVVRNFLEKLFANMETTARELELVGAPAELEVEEGEDEEEVDTDEEEDEDETTEETSEVDEEEVEPETSEGTEEDVTDEEDEEDEETAAEKALNAGQHFDTHAYMRERANDFV